MYALITIAVTLIASAHSISYNRYDTTDQYDYRQYSTVGTLYNQYNNREYGSRHYTDGSRYPSPSTRYASHSPNTYTTESYYNTGYNNNNYNTGSKRLYNNNYGHTSPSYERGHSAYEYPFLRNDRDHCKYRNPQNGIYVERLMGMWYGVEYIYHQSGSSRVDYSRTCIVMHLAEPVIEPPSENQLSHVQHINAKFQQDYRHLRLLWDESGRTTEYALFFRNDSAGFWQVADGQNGTLNKMDTFRQFSGTVQVLKAVKDHLLLHFCQEATDTSPAQLYSVLFSRDLGAMPQWEITSVHTLLENKQLSVTSRRMVCGNGVDRIGYSILLSILSCVLASFVVS